MSGKRARVIPLSDKAAAALGEYIQFARAQMIREKNEEVVFVNCAGTSMSRQGFWKIVKEYARSANITSDISPHVLRHSFAAHQLASGANILQLKEMMGHADITATQVYLRAIN